MGRFGFMAWNGRHYNAFKSWSEENFIYPWLVVHIFRLAVTIYIKLEVVTSRTRKFWAPYFSWDFLSPEQWFWHCVVCPTCICTLNGRKEETFRATRLKKATNIVYSARIEHRYIHHRKCVRRETSSFLLSNIHDPWDLPLTGRSTVHIWCKFWCKRKHRTDSWNKEGNNIWRKPTTMISSTDARPNSNVEAREA